MNHKKVNFLTYLMQNVQKLNMVGCRALNGRQNHYGPPCIDAFSVYFIHANKAPASY